MKMRSYNFCHTNTKNPGNNLGIFCLITGRPKLNGYEKIVTLPEVIVVAPACPRDKGELLIPTFNTNINYDDYKK